MKFQIVTQLPEQDSLKTPEDNSENSWLSWTDFPRDHCPKSMLPTFRLLWNRQFLTQVEQRTSSVLLIEFAEVSRVFIKCAQVALVPLQHQGLCVVPSCGPNRVPVLTCGSFVMITSRDHAVPYARFACHVNHLDGRQSYLDYGWVHKPQEIRFATPGRDVGSNNPSSTTENTSYQTVSVFVQFSVPSATS